MVPSIEGTVDEHRDRANRLGSTDAAGEMIVTWHDDSSPGPTAAAATANRVPRNRWRRRSHVADRTAVALIGPRKTFDERRFACLESNRLLMPSMRYSFSLPSGEVCWRDHGWLVCYLERSASLRWGLFTTRASCYSVCISTAPRRAGWMFIHDAEGVVLLYVNLDAPPVCGLDVVHPTRSVVLLYLYRDAPRRERLGVVHDAERRATLICISTLRVVRVDVYSRRGASCYL